MNPKDSTRTRLVLDTLRLVLDSYSQKVDSTHHYKSGFFGSGRVWVEQGRAGLCEFGDASFGSVGSYNKRVVDKEDFPPM